MRHMRHNREPQKREQKIRFYGCLNGKSVLHRLFSVKPKNHPHHRLLIILDHNTKNSNRSHRGDDVADVLRIKISCTSVTLIFVLYHMLNELVWHCLLFLCIVVLSLNCFVRCHIFSCPLAQHSHPVSIKDISLSVAFFTDTKNFPLLRFSFIGNLL